MPGSVQLIDNRLVFANSVGGVYMIASTEGKAEENVKPLSGNVNGTSLARGLLRDDFDVDWTAAGESWTYETPYSLTAAGDIMAKYQKGDKLRLVQNGALKYYRIAGVNYADSNTHIQLAGEAALQNAPVTDICFSYDTPLRASSIDYDRKYWLCVGSRVYLWDYELTPYYGYADYEKAQKRLAWFLLDNIAAGLWHGGRALYYAPRSGARMVRFMDKPSDFGQAIEAYWVSKALDFGAGNYLKTVDRVYISLRTDTNCAVAFEIHNEKTGSVPYTGAGG